jgi:hypothetical protein
VHLGRGVFGILYVSKMPQSHDMLQHCDDFDTPRDSLAEVREKSKIKIAIEILVQTNVNKLYIRLYSMGTLVCILIDSLCFCV